MDIPKLKKIICGEVSCKTENDENGINDYRINVYDTGISLSHFIVKNGEEVFQDGFDMTWDEVWNKLNGEGGSKLLPK